MESLPDEEAQCLGDTLWWMTGRKFIIRRFLSLARSLASTARIMDIGCGSGENFDVLSEFGEVIGVEPSEILASRARKRGIATTVFNEDAQNLVECHDVDLFTMFDVIEHIEDDARFLFQLRAKASAKHSLLVSVPACPFLYGPHDKLLQHHRRYSSASIRHVLNEAGYKVILISYSMCLLFPFALLYRTKELLMAKLGKPPTSINVGDVPFPLSTLFTWTLRIENYLSGFVRFPVGLWLFVLATSGDEIKVPKQ